MGGLAVGVRVRGSGLAVSRAPNPNRVPNPDPTPTPNQARQRYDYLKTVKKQKGYVQLQTSHGSINIELHCDTVPMTCENFITLCERDYYRGVPFHRIIKNFMLQGGDPTGTGTGGESMWGKPFKDECTNKLRHEGRGVLGGGVGGWERHARTPHRPPI